MKIAVISDIHANLPALQAVYRHLVKQEADAVYCLGDLVNQNVWNNEVVEFISSHHIPCVLGNHDEGIGNNMSKFPFYYANKDEAKWGLNAIEYTLGQVTAQNKDFLKHLPLRLKVNVKTGNELRTIVFAHGSPTNNKERVYGFSTQDEMSKMLDEQNGNVLLIGNTHASFHKVVKRRHNGVDAYQHFINPGSVGYPKDGDWHACYAILNIDEKRDIRFDLEAVEVDFYRLGYDINKVINAIKKSPLHIHYAMRLIGY